MYLNVFVRFDADEKVEYEVAKDMKKAYEFALKGCDLGNMYSCANVSQMYMKGDGVEKNEKLADKYKKKALELQEQVNAPPITFQQGLPST